MAKTSTVCRAVARRRFAEQSPAVSPPARFGAAMAYDAATRTVVLFGGVTRSGVVGSTWTWNGSTWTQQSPASSPPARELAAMTYDVATGTVVLFGGNGRHFHLADTWTWNGSTWAKQSPAAHPSARVLAAMAYDAATGTAVLFGGLRTSTGLPFGDTWTWDGTDWTQQAPPAHPAARQGPAMAYDAATSTAVLFGGTGHTGNSFHDTWTWG
jgi:galactose oxidase-like protein